MQYTFDIEIPKEIITEEKHDSINFEYLDNKRIFALVGYAGSGKDTIADKFVKQYGFKRIAFADNLKTSMNMLLREKVYEDLKNKNINIEFEDVDFVNTKNREIKEIIRPYIIWFGETVRTINGPYFWINKMFSEDASGYYDLIISDLRRVKELEIFQDSNNFNKRTTESLAEASYFTSFKKPFKNYSSLLFHVNQYGLVDNDVLTIETIRTAQEQWLFDDTFYIDSRLPVDGNYRNKAIDLKVNNICKKYNIIKPAPIKGHQITIFD